MNKKILSAALGCVFTFILITTAWDYCAPAGEASRPDLDKLSSERGSMISGLRMEKEHHPCASLKDAYNISSVLKTSEQRGSIITQQRPSVWMPVSFKDGDFGFHGLSPPGMDVFPPHYGRPLFLLNQSLLI